MVAVSLQPRITDSTSDGAYSVTPIASVREKMKRRLVSVRVRVSNRFCRYS
jgi:hypothetical protein